LPAGDVAGGVGQKKPPQPGCDGTSGVKLTETQVQIFPARYRNTSPWRLTSLTNAYLLPLMVAVLLMSPPALIELAILCHNLSIVRPEMLSRNNYMIFCYIN
jgi:hypothetical protein